MNPRQDADDTRTYTNIQSVKYDLKVKGIDENAKDLIQKFLQVRPSFNIDFNLIG